MILLRILPIGGTAIALTGYKPMLGRIGNFILGALIPLGIGNYAFILSRTMSLSKCCIKKYLRKGGIKNVIRILSR